MAYKAVSILVRCSLLSVMMLKGSLANQYFTVLPEILHQDTISLNVMQAPSATGVVWSEVGCAAILRGVKCSGAQRVTVKGRWSAHAQQCLL